MRYSIFFVFPLLLLLNNSVISAAEISQGTMLSNSCSACHGTDGKSPGAIPGIYGKSAKFLTQALTEFRSGNRQSTVMERHARGYSDQEIKLIADYFASLK